MFELWCATIRFEMYSLTSSKQQKRENVFFQRTCKHVSFHVVHLQRWCKEQKKKKIPNPYNTVSHTIVKTMTNQKIQIVYLSVNATQRWFVHIVLWQVVEFQFTPLLWKYPWQTSDSVHTQSQPHTGFAVFCTLHCKHSHIFQRKKKLSFCFRVSQITSICMQQHDTAENPMNEKKI